MDLIPFKNCLAHKQSVYISNENNPYKPCCFFKTGIDAKDFDDYKNKLSKLDIFENCSHCIKQEQSGAKWSHRHLFKNSNELVLGICLDNMCNLKCVICSPTFSSRLINEWDKLNLFKNTNEKKHYIRLGQQAPNKINFIKNVLLNSSFDTLRLEIFGGEPLINPFVFEFIDWIAEQPYADKTFLSITSNATTYTEKIKEYSYKFKLVSLQLSIDGIENTFEYLRYLNTWQQTTQIVNSYYQLVNQLSNFTLSFNYTLSWMNSLHFANFYNWAATNYPKVHLYLTKLEHPEYFSVNVLSQKIRDKIVFLVEQEIIKLHISVEFEKILDLYKQSMIINNFDEFNFQSYMLGKKTLSDKDSLRTMNYKQTLNPILSLIHYETS